MLELNRLPITRRLQAPQPAPAGGVEDEVRGLAVASAEGDAMRPPQKLSADLLGSTSTPGELPRDQVESVQPEQPAGEAKQASYTAIIVQPIFSDGAKKRNHHQQPVRRHHRQSQCLCVVPGELLPHEGHHAGLRVHAHLKHMGLLPIMRCQCCHQGPLVQLGRQPIHNVRRSCAADASKQGFNLLLRERADLVESKAKLVKVASHHGRDRLRPRSDHHAVVN
mmetsp:Transcript_91922/g.263280  ORF Transcript_91922/g.263280 Transcript_91922/m.263280 type:complete len:223 (+) Transcript_91922:1074-1742(+)